MLKIILFSICLLVPVRLLPGMATAGVATSVYEDVAEEVRCAAMYSDMHLEGVVNWQAFKLAVQGYHAITERRRKVLTLIDFTLPSTEERMFVFDMEQRQLLFTSLVAHGKNSGEMYATSFSNVVGSYKSSLGFYLTADTYQGKNGYSLILDGLEQGVNDRARERAIVVHGASYANPSVVRQGGRLGRSLGCPAVPTDVSKSIINAIKGGSVLFIYADNAEYLAKSTLLRSGALSVQVR